MRRRLGTCANCGAAVRAGQAYILRKGRRQGLIHSPCPPKLVLVKS